MSLELGKMENLKQVNLNIMMILLGTHLSLEKIMKKTPFLSHLIAIFRERKICTVLPSSMNAM